jgi:hypothetical protein
VVQGEIRLQGAMYHRQYHHLSRPCYRHLSRPHYRHLGRPRYRRLSRPRYRHLSRPRYCHDLSHHRHHHGPHSPRLVHLGLLHPLLRGHISMYSISGLHQLTFHEGITVHLVVTVLRLCLGEMRLSSASGHFAMILQQFPTIQLEAIQFTLWVATKLEVWVEPAAFEAGVTALTTCRHGGWGCEVFDPIVLKLLTHSGGFSLTWHNSKRLDL